MSSKSRTLYTGMTSRLARCVREHEEHKVGTFVARYRVIDLSWTPEPIR